MRVRLCQISVHYENPEVNASKIRDRLKFNEDLIVFPEAATSGFPYRRLGSVTEFNSRFVEEIRALTETRDGIIVLPALVTHEGQVVNRQHWISGGKIIAQYDKVHLIGVLGEDRFLAPGSEPVSSPIGDFVGGAATCYDLRFPELFRILVKKGVDLFILPAMWPVQRATHLTALARGRAIENQAFVMVCNACGSCGPMDLCGQSAAFDPRGELIAEAGLTETDLAFQIDAKAASDWRAEFPVLRDIRLI